MRSPHTAMKSSLCSMQLEKARAKQQRLIATKNKLIKTKKKIKKKNIFFFFKEIIKVVGCVENQAVLERLGGRGSQRGMALSAATGLGNLANEVLVEVRTL